MQNIEFTQGHRLNYPLNRFCRQKVSRGVDHYATVLNEWLIFHYANLVLILRGKHLGESLKSINISTIG